MTDEAPRDPATLAADALDVLAQADAIGRATAAATNGGSDSPMAGAHAWQTARLARQLAELAQNVARLDAAANYPGTCSAPAPSVGFGTITLPLDANGEPLAWPDGRGGWIDAWRGVYTDADHLRAELPHWTANPGARTLAYGVTTWEAE